MPCRSDYLAPSTREVGVVVQGTDELKEVVDELVHFCDTTRDALEAYFDDETPDLPAISKGHELAGAIYTHIHRIKDEYGYRGKSDGPARAAADAMFEVAGRVIVQFERISEVLRQLQRDGQPTQQQIDQLRQDQIQHRMGDMLRVYQHYANVDTLSAEEVAMLSSIDFTKPLTPQLGFDPDTV